MAWAGDTISLITGKAMEGWSGDTGAWAQVGEISLREDDEKFLASKPGTGSIVNGDDGRTHNLISNETHGDCILKLGFIVPKGSNSGVYLQGRYEIQVLDSYKVPDKRLQHSDCGGIYQRYIEKEGKGYEVQPPRVNASRAPGEWQEYEIWFRAPRFDAKGTKTENAKFVKVIHNGTVIHENAEVTGPTRAATWLDTEVAMAPLMLQGDHGPVAYRKIELTHTEFE
jgi:hypothetical protein